MKKGDTGGMITSYQTPVNFNLGILLYILNASMFLRHTTLFQYLKNSSDKLAGFTHKYKL